eukprot:6177057-Pleurochrysis_carterae.AAC.2
MSSYLQTYTAAAHPPRHFPAIFWFVPTSHAAFSRAFRPSGARLARDAHLRALRLVARAAASGEAARRGLRAARSHRALHRHAGAPMHG